MKQDSVLVQDESEESTGVVEEEAQTGVFFCSRPTGRKTGVTYVECENYQQQSSVVREEAQTDSEAENGVSKANGRLRRGQPLSLKPRFR